MPYFVIYYVKLLVFCVQCITVIGCSIMWGLCVNIRTAGNNRLAGNLHYHFHAFSGWGTSRGPKLFLKAFLHTILYNYYSKKKFGSVSSQKIAPQKMDFPLYFKM